MNVREIVSARLREIGANGLYNGDGECGCGLDDLMPCMNDASGIGDCEPATAHACPCCGERYFVPVAAGDPLAMAAALDRIGELSGKVVALEDETAHLIQAAEIVKEQRDALQERVCELEEKLGDANNRLCAGSLAKLAAEPEPAPDIPVKLKEKPSAPRVKVKERERKPRVAAAPPSPGEPVSQFDDAKSGLVGQSPRSQEPTRFRLTNLETGATSRGTAAELAKAHGMSPSEIYRWAGGKRKSRKWKVERI